MRLSFIFPTALWSFALLIPLWWLALAVPRRLSAPRFWASLLARTALVGTLVFAMAGAQLIRPSVVASLGARSTSAFSPNTTTAA